MIPDTLLSIIGMYDSLKPVVMKGSLEGSFLASFLLGWYVDLPSLLLFPEHEKLTFPILNF